MIHLRHPRPSDVVLDELRGLATSRRSLTAQLAAVDGRINRLLDDLTAARAAERAKT